MLPDYFLILKLKWWTWPLLLYRWGHYPNLFIDSCIAIILQGGTSNWILCTEVNTKPPWSARDAMFLCFFLISNAYLSQSCQHAAKITHWFGNARQRIGHVFSIFEIDFCKSITGNCESERIVNTWWTDCCHCIYF